MLIILTSPDTIAPGGQPRTDIATALITAKAEGHPVAVISNRAKPAWFESTFGASRVQFLEHPGRQDGRVIQENAKRLGLNPYDVIVLAGKTEDIAMAKNGGALIVAAGWSTDNKVQNLGVPVKDGDELLEVLALTDAWSGKWWFTGNAVQGGYSVRALADLSSMYGQSDAQKVFATNLKNTVKSGGARLTALLTVTARSLLKDGISEERELFWGVYPSSKSANNDTEILSDFSHRLRTVASRVQFARRGEPLFIRHRPSSKRSAGGSLNRNDPSEQLLTLHLNPFYKKKLLGRHVILLDDCTTYGVSFGVAAALLRRAGARSMTAIALGKFGNCLSDYRIEIAVDPCAPLTKNGYTQQPLLPLHGITNEAAKVSLRSLVE
ncbi:hypothetical protein [Thauera sp.]|uniref:hypothetical protein n=1 Tax=Thauera sp. TaxID=1905334 RepID=UPI001B5D280B|nr:hypothetical protein [Thauera sp.]MBP6132861.1 hypothetical protein [Thauera sp.]MBP7048406.1 hypothetical protein [Thauera sp.]